MNKKEKITHSNESNRISDSTYDASVHYSDNNTVGDFRKITGIEVRNKKKTIKKVQMKNGDPSDVSYQLIRSLCQFIFGCGSVFMLNQEKFLKF